MRSAATKLSLVRASARYSLFTFGGLVVLLLGVRATLLFFDLGSRVLSTNDEARFPMQARDILSEGHWLLPRLDGIPHLNKPPHAWLIALASWPTGAVTPCTASLPSVLSALVVPSLVSPPPAGVSAAS